MKQVTVAAASADRGIVRDKTSFHSAQAHKRGPRSRASQTFVVMLLPLGARLISRSEAKRLLAGLDRFAEVVLDFNGVEEIGQGFADEVFRVWARAHPKVRLKPVNMSEAVEFMVRRATP